MAIQVRRGLEEDLDISKAVPGEFLISTDSKKVRVCIQPGIVKELASIEDVADAIKNGIESIEEAEENALINISDGVDKTLSVSGKAADAKTTGDKVSQLSLEIDYNRNECYSTLGLYEVELLDLNTMIEGKYVIYSNGILDNNAEFATTDFIKVLPTMTYKVVGGSGGSQVAFYDKNQNYIAGLISGEKDIVVPDNINIVYMRWCTALENKANASIKIDPLIKKTVKTTFTVNQDGNGDYTSLLECVLVATEHKNAKIYVDKGDYDLVAEFENYYGNDFFENYDHNINPLGIVLKNDIHIIFDTQAAVHFNYAGSNENVLKYFSPFNNISGDNGFTLENLTLIVSRARYCVHDEHYSSNVPYNNKYIGCYMELDNSNNEVWEAPQCIGGGLGVNGNVLIEKCYFKTHSDTRLTAEKDMCSVSYHNSESGNAKSKIVAVGNYVDGDYTFRFTHYGNSELLTDCLVSNNSVGSAIWVGHEVNGATTPENMNVLSWNNHVRE